MRPNKRNASSTCASWALRRRRARPRKSWCSDSTQSYCRARWSCAPRSSLPRSNGLPLCGPLPQRRACASTQCWLNLQQAKTAKLCYEGARA
jgi:hypothetical protein